MIIEKVKLYKGDSLSILDELINEKVKVSHIVTDPPFNISQKNNFDTLRGKNGRLVHRRGIDFGEWDWGFDQLTWIDKAIQLLDKNGSLIVFNSWENLGIIKRHLETLGFKSKDIFRWVKTNPFPKNRDRRYIVDYELGAWFVRKNAKYIFNRQDEKYQRPEFVYPIVGGSEKTIHTTQKPLALMEDLIKIHTNENDLILDPFMGSGTTGLACMNLNRRFIGIEIDDKYFDVAKERLGLQDEQTKGLDRK